MAKGRQEGSRHHFGGMLTPEIASEVARFFGTLTWSPQARTDVERAALDYEKAATVLRAAGHALPPTPYPSLVSADVAERARRFAALYVCATPAQQAAFREDLPHRAEGVKEAPLILRALTMPAEAPAAPQAAPPAPAEAPPKADPHYKAKGAVKG